jgi:glycosyltransferase involved in cell wall biosynthesis
VHLNGLHPSARTSTTALREGAFTVAILPWGDLFTDWLDQLGISFEEFRDEFEGSWMFGYVRALAAAGVRSVVICVTERVAAHVKCVHGPTGVPLHFLPPPRAWRLLRPAMLDAPLGDRRDPLSVSRAALTHMAPYLALPLVTLSRVVRSAHCNAILCQEYETPRFDLCATFGRALGVPVFGTFQGGDYQVSRLERPIRPFSLRLTTGLIVATESERERLRLRYGLPDEKLRRIFNPVDVDFWRPDDRAEARDAEGLVAEAEVVVWHGQVHPRKGLDVLLAAWGRICAERPDRPLELLLIGGRRGAHLLRDEVEHLRLRGVRIVDEWVLDPRRIRRLLSTGDVYAFPSRHEGFPVAPLEAMACGLPVVATDARGVPDILERGERDGGIVVPRDDVPAFAAALGALLDDVSRRHEVARCARRRITTAFALDSVGAELAAFLTGAPRPHDRPGEA